MNTVPAQEIAVYKHNLEKAYEDGTLEQKAFLENLFGANLFLKSSADLKQATKSDYEIAVDDYWKYCEEKGIANKELPYNNPKNDDEKNTNAYVMMKHIIENENGGKLGIPFDLNQWKYYPWFKPDPSGFGLSYGDCGGWSTLSAVPARLCSLDSDRVKPIAEKFMSIYNILQIK